MVLSTSRLCVLVAADSPSDACSTALYLRGLGHEGKKQTSFRVSQMPLDVTLLPVLLLIVSTLPYFDVQWTRALPAPKWLSLPAASASMSFWQSQMVRVAQTRAETAGANSDRVDARKLLVGHCAAPLGAAEVVSLPLQGQHELLNNLWARGVRQRTGSLSSGDDSASTVVDDCSLLSSVFHGDEGFDAYGLDLLTCDYESHQCSADRVPDNSVFNIMDTLLDCDFDSSPAEDDFDVLGSFSATETESSTLSASSCSSVDKKRVREDDGTNSSSSAATSSVVTEPSTRRGNKKSKVDWTPELHSKFIEAVKAIGVKDAVPSQILDRMGPCAAGLTRQNIASHLQKYRNGSHILPVPKSTPSAKRKTNAKPSAVPSASMAVATVAGSSMLPVTSMPPASSVQLQVPPQHWPQMVQMWSPWPQPSPMVYSQVGANVAQFALQASGTAPDTVKRAIKEVLSKPKGKAPLGLALDMSSMMKTLQKMGPELTANQHAAASVAA
eukprot:scaffold130408_cov30-Prasinocladus_malaysianus.AAC.1